MREWKTFTKFKETFPILRVQDILDPLENLILNDLVANVYGIGPVLARYLMWLLGREDHVKPDTILLRLFSGLGEWKPRNGHHEDMNIIRQAITTLAAELGTSPARLDNALWSFESRRKNNGDG